MSDMYKLRLLIEGVPDSASQFTDIADRASDAKPVLRVIKALMEKDAEEQFASKGARGGLEWKPDKSSTVAKKIAAGDPPDTEIMSGDTARSLLGAGSSDTIRRLSKSSTTFGTKVFQAQFQGHERQLLRVTLEDANRWTEMMVKFLLTGESDV